MSQTSATYHLETLIRSAFEEGRCGEYYLVELKVTPSNQITVFMDGDEGVSLDVCKQISRILEAVLDEEPTLGGIYTLEVSSPGVSRSLRFPRQYLKHVGRTLEITLTDDQKIEGVLMTTGHESISLELKAKDKKSQPEMREVKYDDIREAFVVIQFKKK